MTGHKEDTSSSSCSDSDSAPLQHRRQDSYSKRDSNLLEVPKIITPKSGRKPGTRRHVSCQGCRMRKMRCSRSSPCGSCKMRGEKCIWEGATPNAVSEENELDASQTEIARLRKLVDLLMARIEEQDLQRLQTSNVHPHYNHPLILPGGGSPVSPPVSEPDFSLEERTSVSSASSSSSPPEVHAPYIQASVWYHAPEAHPASYYYSYGPSTQSQYPSYPNSYPSPASYDYAGSDSSMSPMSQFPVQVEATYSRQEY